MFIEEYLQDLRRERFAPAATARYLRRAGVRARECIVANPQAVRSVWLLALTFFALAFVGAASLALSEQRALAYDVFLATALTLVPVFMLLTLHLDLLRDARGYRLSAVNLPTVLTLMRVVLVPALVRFITAHQWALAFAVYLCAALSDVADGALARRWGQETRLGTVLDPITDIVFNVAMFVALGVAGLLPVWVVALAVLRYAMLIVGGASLYVFVGPVRIRPTAFGRLSGVVMSALVAFLLLLMVAGGRTGESLAPLTRDALGVLLGLTVGQVVALGWYNVRMMTGAARVPGRVVDDVPFGARR
jgi:cardiolipin synthase (CMP-forming)